MSASERWVWFTGTVDWPTTGACRALRVASAMLAMDAMSASRRNGHAPSAATVNAMNCVRWMSFWSPPMDERYYTNAPNAYDYSYVETIESGLREGGRRSVWQPWRLISVSDAERFARYQLPRYNSGGYAALRADSKEAQCLELRREGTGQ